MFPIHDRGYKRLFSNQRFFRQLLETFVNETWITELDLERCKKVEKSFISEHYKATESDILYQVPFHKQEAYVYILIEFQSTVNWFMVLRLLHYLCSFWLDYAENHPKSQKLPPIFPILLYSGEEPWTAATQLEQLWEQPDLFAAYQPQFRYFKIIETEYSQAQLLHIGNLVSTLFLAETQPDIELLQNELLKLFDREADKPAISLLLNWFKQLVVHGRRSATDYHDLEAVVTSKAEAKTMLETAIEQAGQKYFEQGKAEGKLEGKLEGKAEGKLEGKVEGKLEGQAEMLILLLETRFGQIDLAQKNYLYNLDTNQLLKLSTKLWNAQSWQELLASE